MLQITCTASQMHDLAADFDYTCNILDFKPWKDLAAEPQLNM